LIFFFYLVDMFFSLITPPYFNTFIQITYAPPFYMKKPLKSMKLTKKYIANNQIFFF